MSIPTVPVANFIIIQAGLAFAFLKTLLDRVPRGGHLGQLEQGHVGRRIRQVVGSSVGSLTERRTTSQLSRPGRWSRLSITRAQAQS